MMSSGRRAMVFSAILIAMGVAIVARTVSLGVGGGLGLLIGGLLIAGGALRLYLVTRP
ncbi:MAG: hypothetical protein JHC74_01955 [Thermoleophilia bacterium]|jgi:hypothetical protein|nr:hypothetical protein [Thermoleophilia bacterium]